MGVSLDVAVYEIQGQVRGAGGRPLADASVVVKRQLLRKSRTIGRTRTSVEGDYEVRLEVGPGEPRPLLVVVEASSPELRRKRLRSPITTLAPKLQIDLSLEPVDTSEWGTLTAAMAPWLEGVKFDELVETKTHHELSFLSAEIGQGTEAIMRVVVAARLEAAFEVPAAVFYAFVRQQIPSALPSPLLDAADSFTLIDGLVRRIGSLIFALSSNAQTQALTAAVALDLIGAEYTAEIPKLVAALQTRAGSDLLSSPFLVGNTSLSDLLTVASLPSEQQQAFAKALTDNTQSIRNFWRTLGDGTHGLTADQASAAERTLSIGAFVKNYTPLISKLVDGFSAGTYTSLSDLARLSVSDWESLVKETGAPPSVDATGAVEPATVFAQIVYTRVTRAYPTIALAGRIGTDELVPEPERAPLATFFANSPELELLKNSIPVYLESNAQAAFAGIDEADQAGVVANARRLQRVLRVAPGTDAATALLSAGFSSATEIANLGQQQFSERGVAGGLTAGQAIQVFQAASQRYASTVSVFTQLNFGALGVWPKAIGTVDDLSKPASSIVERDPTLATLFGEIEDCATDDCTSVFSPAAYLCDLLLWLRNHPQGPGTVPEGSGTVLDVLDGRRPDIRDLLLNCPNTETELPYIDLVIELLADTISPPVDAVSTSLVHRGLTDGATYFYVVTAVNAVGQGAASAEVSVTPEKPTAPPAAPAGVVAEAGNGEVRLAWTPTAYTDSYNVYYGAATGVTPATGTKLPASGDGLLVLGLANGTEIFFIVTGVNAAGESAASAEASATPAAVVPAAPVPVVLAGDGQVTVTWSDAAGADGYELYRSTDSSVSPLNTLSVNVTSPFTDTELVNGTEYFYVLTASNPLGESPASATVSATPVTATVVPDVPANLTATPGDGGVTLAWDPVRGATSYNVFWATASGVTTQTGTEIAGSPNPRWKQTSEQATSAELTAAPEYFNQDAFATLAEASYPFALPYSAGLDALRTYLRWLKVPLWQLRQALLPAGATADAAAAVAAERFGLSPHGEALVTTANLVAPSVAWNTPNPASDLAPVDAFMIAASISYEQLLELLQVTWVQQGLGVSIGGIDDTCQTSTQRLIPAPLDAGFLDRAHRFLRLWSATGYEMWELDLLLQAPSVTGGATDGDGLLAGLFDSRLLQDATGLPVDRQLAFFGDIDTTSHRASDGSTTTSLYAQLFLNSVPLDPDLDVIPAGGIATTPLDDPSHLPVFQAALGVSGDDAATLFALTDHTLTLSNLSLIYRVSALASAAKLSIGDLLTLAGTLAPTAATAVAAVSALLTSPSATLAFLSQATAIRQATLSQDGLQYLLTPPTAPAGLTAAVATADTKLSVGGAAQFPAPPFYATLGGAEVVQVTEVAGADWTATRGALGTTPQAWAMATAVELYEGWSTGVQMLNADIAATLTAVGKAAASLPAGADVPGAVVAAVAANAHNATGGALANDVTAAILETLTLPGGGQSLLGALSDSAFLASDAVPTPMSAPDQFLAVRTLDKAAVLVRALRLNAAEVGWLMANGTEYGGLDLTQLPVTSGQGQLGITGLLSLLLVVQQQRLWTAAPAPAPVQSLFALIDGIVADTLTTVDAVQAALATITGWPAADIAAFADALGASSVAAFASPQLLDALRRLQAMAGAASAAGYQLVNWATPPVDEPTAQSLADGALGVIRAAQPTEDAWLTLAPSLMNPLRERRSAALRAYLIGLRDAGGGLLYADADALFDYFLIDVQMSSCMLTSRVVQAYIAVQVFVERCLLGLEVPRVTVDPADETWQQWEWMRRYRVWEADREVFLYPENYLVESERPSRTEIYETFEQAVRQGQSTADALESTVHDYIASLDGLAHLVVTGTCEGAAPGSLFVVARTTSDPPTYYYREFLNGEWGGWIQVPINIQSTCVVPAVHRGRLCLFWVDVKVANEPQQNLPAAQQSTTAPSQKVERYVSLGVYFSTFRNGGWQPPQASKGKLFDKPPVDPTQATDQHLVERLYTIRVQSPAPAPNQGQHLWVDVFRRGEETAFAFLGFIVDEVNPSVAVHLGRAVYDGAFEDLELNSGLAIVVRNTVQNLLTYAQATYGPDAATLIPLTAPDPTMMNDGFAVPEAGAMVVTPAADLGQSPGLQFTSTSTMDLNGSQYLLEAAPLPYRVVGLSSELNFDPASDFIFQDNRRCWWVEAQRLYWTGSAFSPVSPSSPSSTPYELQYVFHPFYHPFTRLLGQQLDSGGFDLLYDPNLQQNPDQIAPGGADAFSFQAGYLPNLAHVSWDHDDNGQDRQFLDFSLGGAFSVYNWELFYHVPMYVALLLGQNLQFEDAERWLRYVFDPTRQSTDPAPQRYWIAKPLHDLSTGEILAEQINNLLLAVDNGDAAAVAEIEQWRADPFNPFLLADQRPVAYMKATVMAYLDNLIAWGDNLFSTDSREALSEATLLYIIADEILGSAPAAVTPPAYAAESFNQLAPKLDAFANALVEIENVVTGVGASGGAGTAGTSGQSVPAPQTFYFKIPSNQKLLGYWSTVADRLFKLRHCQDITGAPLALALFDAPIDPALLIAGQAGGADLSSVLQDLMAPLPNYRFTALYPVAMDFVNAVRAYGSELQAALEKKDASQLALLQQTLQRQLLIDGSSVLQFQVEQAQLNIAAAQDTHDIAQNKIDWNTDQLPLNDWEADGIQVNLGVLALYATDAISEYGAAGSAVLPQFVAGVAGFGATPTAEAAAGGKQISDAMGHASRALNAIIGGIRLGAQMLEAQGRYERARDSRQHAIDEATIEKDRATDQINAATQALQIAQKNQALHQELVDNLQQQIDFLYTKFTSEALYDWMISSLSGTYFQAYQLTYQMCKQVERCYQFELGSDDTFIEFGYWDSLHKGLLAGESLQHDLRRMQSSYLQKNSRRYEISRFLSLATLDPAALENLLLTGECDFSIPESLFDTDYPGHYNRRLTRVAVNVVYPNPGRYDNVKATLTMAANKVRTATDISAGYAETGGGADSRFAYNYAAVPQTIVTGNGQDDPGLFVTAIASNISDQRYLPFENAGAISSWHLEMPELSNEINIATVGDIQLHLHYTALDGGAELKQAASAAVPTPSGGFKLVSALNDFGPPWPPRDAEPYPQTPWFTFIEPPPAGGEQVLSLGFSASKFPTWARTKPTLTITQVDVLAISWGATPFTMVPQSPLPTAPVTMNLVSVPQPTTLPVDGPQPSAQSGPNVFHASLTGLSHKPGAFAFAFQHQGAADFASLTQSDIADIVVVVTFTV